MKLSPVTISFLQAAGLVGYVLLFAFTVQGLGELDLPEPPAGIGIAAFLLVFITSALICGSLALGYPAFLFFSGRRGEAARIVLGTLGWLILFLGAFLLFVVG